MKRALFLFLLIFCTSCASGQTSTAPAPAPAEADAAAGIQHKRTWKDRLGLTQLSNDAICTYKLLAFFADARGNRPERRTSTSDTVLSCLSDK